MSSPASPTHICLRASWNLRFVSFYYSETMLIVNLGTTSAETDRNDAVGPRTNVDPCTQDLGL